MNTKTRPLIPSLAPSALALAIEDYLASCRWSGRRTLRTIDNYTLALKRLFLPWCEREGIVSPADLNRRVLEQYAGKLADEGGLRGATLSKASRHSYLRPVNSFINWLRQEGEAVDGRAPLPSVPRQIKVVLSKGDIDLMEGVARNERDRLIVRTLAETGMRRGELAALTSGDLIESRRQFFLRAHGKGGRDRQVAVTPELFKRLQDYVRRTNRSRVRTDHLFLTLKQRGGDFGGISGSGVQQLVQLLGREAGLRITVGPHLFRHSYITRMLEMGTPTKVVADSVGHSSTQMIDRHYAHIRPTETYDMIIKALRA